MVKVQNKFIQCALKLNPPHRAVFVCLGPNKSFSRDKLSCYLKKSAHNEINVPIIKTTQALLSGDNKIMYL